MGEKGNQPDILFHKYCCLCLVAVNQLVLANYIVGYFFKLSKQPKTDMLSSLAERKRDYYRGKYPLILCHLASPLCSCSLHHRWSTDCVLSRYYRWLDLQPAQAKRPQRTNEWDCCSIWLKNKSCQGQLDSGRATVLRLNPPLQLWQQSGAWFNWLQRRQWIKSGKVGSECILRPQCSILIIVLLALPERLPIFTSI